MSNTDSVDGFMSIARATYNLLVEIVQSSDELSGKHLPVTACTVMGCLQAMFEETINDDGCSVDKMYGTVSLVREEVLAELNERKRTRPDAETIDHLLMRDLDYHTHSWLDKYVADGTLKRFPRPEE